MENNKYKNKRIMKDLLHSLLMVAFGAFLTCASIVGCAAYSAYKEYYSQVEYASETDNRFYQKMINMERNQTLDFNGFPTSLNSILFLKIAPGERILNCGDEPLILLFRDLNREDINRYPYYIIKDTHNNYWSLKRHNDKFRLTRINEVWEKKWLKKLEDQIKPKPN